MPRRRTKRGTERTPLAGEADVLVCGASFAGLAVARELAGARRADGAPARVLMLDRYEIGERQTSACAAPTGWLEALGLTDALRQTFRDLVINTPHGTSRYRLPWSWSTFDYPTLCELLDDQNDATFETAKVEGRSGATVHTDRGDVSAPLIVDALGWRRMLAPVDTRVQPPDAPLSRGLEVHPGGAGDELEIWIDRSYVREGYSWSFPAGEEVRIGVGSFDPRAHVKEPTVRLAEDLGTEAVGYQGNWIPHRLRPAAEDGIFFAGDSAGHCLPLSAEGIRTALYFGIACGRELRDVLEGRTTREAALRRYAAFSAGHRHRFGSMLSVQRLIPHVPPRLLTVLIRAMGTQRFVDWTFGHYLKTAPPEFVHAAPPRVSAARAPEPLAVAA
ncbi:MAG: geranylgeranyl reductase [uncultured Solirubrobacterales bacterium]|uniref:Geranylgeranyl reductase n=1 Tax=uncultured Solirubrobacterales bacterium TaxID=768556 RepID=A0A6J4RUB8_9ACTN|nr:MAG: geranylgeranyl reductase [uncultured Solirubrobacterales bacterium]